MNIYIVRWSKWEGETEKFGNDVITAPNEQIAREAVTRAQGWPYIKSVETVLETIRVEGS